MLIKGIVHTGVVVDNIEEAMEFYCGTLGLKVHEAPCDWVEDTTEVVAMGVDPGLHRIATLIAPDGGKVELVQFEKSQPMGEYAANDIIGKHHISFMVDDIYAWVDKLAEQGLKPFLAPMAYETDEAEGGTAYWMQFRDPYGVTIEMMQF